MRTQTTGTLGQFTQYWLLTQMEQQQSFAYLFKTAGKGDTSWSGSGYFQTLKPRWSHWMREDTVGVMYL
jgi:hypothetical protein